MRLPIAPALFALIVLIAAPSARAADKESCLYLTEQGVIKQANSLAEVPESLRAQAKCYKSRLSAGEMAAPEEVELKGTVRKESIASSVGRIELRWPRSLETLFGRTPQRAMADSARAVSRALKGAAFPPIVQTLDLDWKVVFMDENVPETQIPHQLVSGCHPGWMTPPSNIYIVAQRVAAGCGGGQKATSSVADAQLAQVIIHEMGHAIEYQILQNAFGMDRMRAEGFASWFEQYASEYSTVIPNGSAERYYAMLARESLKQSPGVFTFSGSPYDYARASSYFRAIEGRRGVRGIMDVYTTMRETKLTFMPAIQKRLGWNEARLNSEVLRVISK